MYCEKIVDVKTGKETIREYTAEETAEVEAAQAQAAALVKEAAALKKARTAVLEKLGLTDEEVKVLIS